MRATRHAYEVDGWGVGELWAADGRCVAHEPPSRPVNTPMGTPGAPTKTLSPPPSQDFDVFVPELLRRIHSYFAGARIDFSDIPLDLEDLTPFQNAVARALRRVPWGEVVAYGELAVLAGYPRAGRAVGTFCARNRLFLFLPCHRVVGADDLGSYGSLGLSYKRRLLRLEGHDAL